jgi:hypothetical protein
MDDHTDAPAREALRAAIADIGRARRQLDLLGAAAVEEARGDLELAVARLEPVAVDDRLPSSERRRAERCRDALSVHLTAMRDLDAAGVSPAKVAGLLQRGAAIGAAEVGSGGSEG